MNPSQLNQRVSTIRRRLWGLLLQAFGLVVLLTVVLLLGVLLAILSTVSRNTEELRPPLVASLETFYVARGSWVGVEQLPSIPVAHGFFDATDLNWREVIVLDEEGRVLLDHGLTDSSAIGQPYAAGERDIRFNLSADGHPIGTLLIDSETQAFRPFQLSTGFLLWTAFLSIFPAILTVIIALLLARRVVKPLADVMGAAQAVSSGDLTARVDPRDTHELHDLIESFNQMATALERSDHERRDMLADVAHELRTPLTVIRGRLEGIIEGVYASDEAHITPVLEEVYLLERLVEDLRLLTLAETRQLQLHLMQVNLAESATRIALLLEAEALEKEVHITVEANPAISAVLGDPQRIDQVINNLLSNALRYVPKQGQVLIKFTDTIDGVSLSVIDNGPGVPEQELPHIFDRFWRHDKSRSRSTAGAGLGLAIARQLLELQGGSISAANDPHGGLIVSVTLPKAVT